MIRLRFCLVLLLCLLSACAVKDRGPTREQIRQALREDPSLVLDVLKQHPVDVLEAVEGGARERRALEQRERFQKALANPVKPEITADRPMLGSPAAPVTVVLYSDFLCPYCARAALTIHQLVEKHPDEVRVFFKHLDLHPQSRGLSEIFEALALKSDTLAWKFHDLAFASQDKIEQQGAAAINAILKEIGADPAKVAKDRKDPRVDKRIDQDEAEAERFEVDGTPTFCINGVIVPGALPLEDLETVIDLVQHKGKGQAGSDQFCSDCANKK